MSTFSVVGRDQNNTVISNQHITTVIPSASITEILERFAIVSAAYNSSERRSEHASICAEGTRDAVLTAITQWMRESDHHRICWLSGRAGTGKSTIAHTIAKQCDQERRLGFSFFFSRRNRDRSDAAKFVPTFAYQLSVFLPAVRDSMKNALERNPAIFHQDIEAQLTQLVVDPLLSIVDSLSTMIIVIDGLDEYEGDVPLGDLVTFFRDLPDRLPFRILFTSRPEARILEIFNSPPMIHQTYHLQLQDFSSRDEVCTFLRARLSTVRDKRGLPSTWPSTDDLNQLSKQSDGLYIYADTLVRFVDDERGDPLERLQSAVVAHRGVDPLYDQVLREARCYPNFERVIGGILFLSRPLSIRALAELLRVTSSNIRVALRGGLSVLIIPGDDEDYIRPYHASLLDFFADRNRANANFLEPLNYNLSIVDDCVKLLHGSLANNVEGREPVRYACRYWCHHLRLVVSCTSGVDHVRSDVKTRIIEFMKNLQSRWLKDWMVIVGNHLNADQVHEDLRVVMAQFKENSAVFPELPKLLQTVDKFLNTFHKKFKENPQEINIAEIRKEIRKRYKGGIIERLENEIEIFLRRKERVEEREKELERFLDREVRTDRRREKELKELRRREKELFEEFRDRFRRRELFDEIAKKREIARLLTEEIENELQKEIEKIRIIEEKEYKHLQRERQKIFKRPEPQEKSPLTWADVCEEVSRETLARRLWF